MRGSFDLFEKLADVVESEARPQRPELSRR